MEATNGVLWDMDGVLVSTGELHFQVWTKTLSARNIPFSREQFRTTFGMNNAGILQLLLGENVAPDLIAEISADKENNFRHAIKGQVQPLPGVLDWLKRLKAWQVGQAIASSAPPANIDALVDELGIRSYFAATVSGADLPGKPNPAVFLEAARQIGVLPERCVVVEDAVAGIEAAKRGGMRCIAVTTTNPAHELKDADVVVERLDALSEDEFARLFPEVLR
jgi:HAD superfamily hydrolase (TIGR01509 family)